MRMEDQEGLRKEKIAESGRIYSYFGIIELTLNIASNMINILAKKNIFKQRLCSDRFKMMMLRKDKNHLINV